MSNVGAGTVVSFAKPQYTIYLYRGVVGINRLIIYLMGAHLFVILSFLLIFGLT